MALVILMVAGAAGMGLAGEPPGPAPAASAPPAAARPPSAPAPAAELLKILLDEHYEQFLRESPTTASMRGDNRYNDRLADVSPEAIARSRQQHRERLERLEGIDLAALDAEQRLNADLLRLELELSLEGARYFPEQLPIDDREGPAISLPQLADSLRFGMEKDYADYAARLEAIPRLLDQYTAQMTAGMAAGRVPPRIAVARTAEQALSLARAEVVSDPTASPFYRPYLGLAAENPHAARARKAIAERVAPAFGRFGEFLRDRYIPACRESIAASDGADGRAGYDFQLRRMTTTRLTADEIHRIGLDEVARIRAEMFRVIARTDFPDKDRLSGDELFRAFVTYLRTDPRFYWTDEKDQIRAYRDIAKRIDAELPGLFGLLPRGQYGVRPIPRFAAESAPNAYYYPGSVRSGVPGFFVVNTYRLDQRPKYEMIALCLHEAVPGHHFQFALTDEMEGVHPMRSLTYHTAFIEGWALYAERLGLEMAGAARRLESAGGDGGTGLYADPYDDFGRLTYEMWRATRLVVDTGIHAKGWTRQAAIDFMLANTALSPLNIEREVDRYIAWPGQATAYKIGELRIRALRAAAERALGERFDLRAFHDVVLSAGAIPLDTLQARVERWVEAVKAK